MKSRLATAAGGVALVLVLPNAALAERGEPSYYAPPTFSDLDIDRNGVLDRAEVQARTPLYGQWGRFDTNSDDMIERSEFAAFEVRPNDSPDPKTMSEGSTH